MTAGTSAEPIGVSFTETMTGYVTLGESDPARGHEQGKAAGTALTFRLTITTDDVHRFVADPAHAEVATGWVDCEELGGRLPVTRGDFNLFVADSPDTRTMLYRLQFADGVGNELTLVGHKEIRDDRGLDVWPDTTTLYTRLLVGHVEREADADAVVTGAGVLRITALAFGRQLTTFRAYAPTWRGRVSGLGTFGSFFIGQLWHIYGPRLGRSRRS